MTGSTLSQAAKRQKQRRLINKKLNDAIEEYQAQKDLHRKASYQKITEQFGVNCITLANHEQGKHRPLSAFNTSKQRLTPAEENILVEVIILASHQGIPYTHSNICEEGNTILWSHLGHQSQEVGKHWVDNFLHCHDDQLHMYWSALLPSVRAKAGNQETISGYFSLVKERIVEPGVSPECMWSMDKTQVNPDGTPTQ